MADEEGLTDDERELLADRAAHARTIVRNPDRIRKVCADIVEHYFSKVAPLGSRRRSWPTTESSASPTTTRSRACSQHASQSRPKPRS